VSISNKRRYYLRNSYRQKCRNISSMGAQWWHSTWETVDQTSSLLVDLRYMSSEYQNCQSLRSCVIKSDQVQLKVVVAIKSVHHQPVSVSNNEPSRLPPNFYLPTSWVKSRTKKYEGGTDVGTDVG
jgi:hypothetical protein